MCDRVGNTMVEHLETDQYGSFIAWGACFFYDYSAPDYELKIHVKEGEKPLVTLAVGKRLHKKIRQLVHYFDKAGQIKALMLSNSETINIAHTMEPRRLRGISNTLFDHALFALDLDAGKPKRFTATQAQIFDLKLFTMRHFTCPRSSTAYYRACLRTHSDNELVGRSLNLHGILMTVSEKIISELIALEFNARNTSAQNLLSLSSRLSSISRILNEEFYPSMKIKDLEAAETLSTSTP